MQIKISNLTHIYDQKASSEFVGINNASFTLEQAGITAFIGHTGSGKTTTIKHLNALLFPTMGEVMVGQHLITPLAKPKKRIKNINDYRQDIGMVFQFPEDQIFEETVEEEIIYGLKMLKKDLSGIDEKINKYLELVGLDSSFRKRNPFELSGGEKRRLAIASILIAEQKILILDEPTASLDVDGNKAIYDLLKKLQHEGIKIIVVTHDLSNVLEHTDEVVVFANSNVVAFGKTKDILYDVDLLKKINLIPPKLVKLTRVLQARGINVPNTTNITDFANAYNKVLEAKNE